MTSTPPAGWYPDPSGEAAARWWDGTAWTEHVTGGVAPATAPVWRAAPVHYVAAGDGGITTPFDLVAASGELLATARSTEREGAFTTTLHTATIVVRDPAGGLVLTHVSPGGLVRQPDVVLAPSGGEWGRLVWTSAWRDDEIDLAAGGATAASVVPGGTGATRFTVVDARTRAPLATVHRPPGAGPRRWVLDRGPEGPAGLTPLLLALPLTLDAVVEQREVRRRVRRRRRRFR